MTRERSMERETYSDQFTIMSSPQFFNWQKYKLAQIMSKTSVAVKVKEEENVNNMLEVVHKEEIKEEKEESYCDKRGGFLNYHFCSFF